MKMNEIDINEVLKYFYEISRIPRMSGKEEKRNLEKEKELNKGFRK